MKRTAFHEEINGTNFAITVARLGPGKYTVLIGEAETFFKEPGNRLFDVTCGDATLAKNFDIFAAAGGADRVHIISSKVDFPGDAVHGPLTLTFTGVKNRAKFNTLEILNDSGATLVSLNASDLADPLTAAANKPPVVNGPVIWKDPSQSIDARVHDLISRMSLAEKVAQIRNGAPAIPQDWVFPPMITGVRHCTAWPESEMPRFFRKRLVWQPHGTRRSFIPKATLFPPRRARNLTITPANTTAMPNVTADLLFGHRT